MPIEIVPHSQEFTPAVEAFNQRMREGGSKWGFYVDPEPDWIPRHKKAKTWREYHLAIEDGDKVRGGYAIKPQQWLVNESLEWVADWQGPFTEAAVDVKYSPLMLRLLRGMQKEHPLLFSLGHGGTAEPIVELLRKMGWDLQGIPFCFYVLNPFRFLRLNSYLRTSTARRLTLDLLAFTGLGFLTIKLLQLWKRLTNFRKPTRAQVEVVPSFCKWTDDLWETHKGAYRCLAVRDSEMMNDLMPQEGWPGGTRLKISGAHGVVGWSIVHDKQMTDDPRFGALKVGLITDCFAAPEDAATVMRASHDYLAAQQVDFIFANLSHPAWIQGLEANGYIVLEHRRIFAISPALKEKLAPYEAIKEGLHLTNMDGHGPHGFQ